MMMMCFMMRLARQPAAICFRQTQNVCLCDGFLKAEASFEKNSAEHKARQYISFSPRDVSSCHLDDEDDGASVSFASALTQQLQQEDSECAGTRHQFFIAITIGKVFFHSPHLLLNSVVADASVGLAAYVVKRAEEEKVCFRKSFSFV